MFTDYEKFYIQKRTGFTRGLVHMINSNKKVIGTLQETKNPC